MAPAKACHRSVMIAGKVYRTVSDKCWDTPKRLADLDVMGLELQAIEAGDLKNAVRVYQEVLASADPKRDALWLPQDSTTVEDSSVLPLILESAWNRNLAVFSSNVSHVKRGALFSLYPNNVALGRQLASSAMSLPSGNAALVVPMKDALLAVNTRTASHLGLQLSSRQQPFDLVFPAR